MNLEDLVDTTRTGERVKQFSSLEELKEYTIQHGKYFPRESAYAGGVLKFLLREILSSYHGGRRLKKRSKKGK